MGEAGGFAEHPGVLQGLPDAEALMRVEDNQLTDLQRDRKEQDRVQAPCPGGTVRSDGADEQFTVESHKTSQV